MAVFSPHQLPGVAFETIPPALTDTLPRMDVAGFVGFASRGPLDVPVAVEDAARFREVFGADPRLGRDGRTGEFVRANLGPAVEEFFRNGGRRCWVVRVADSATATRSAFPLAGLVRVGQRRGRWRLASARARAVGSWADRLAVGTVLASTLLPRAEHLDIAARQLTVAPTAEVVVGDLLRLTFDGGRTAVLVSVSRTSRDRGSLQIEWDRTITLGPPWPASVPPAPVRAVTVTVAGETELPEVPDLSPAEHPGQVVLAFAGDAAPPPGSLLRIDLEDGGVLAAPVVERATASSAGVDGLVRSGRRHVLAAPSWSVGIGSAAAEDAAAATSSPPSIERLSLTLTVWRGQHLESSLEGLGFDPRHPLYWGALPTDEDLYEAGAGAAAGHPRRSGGARGGTAEQLRARAASPRFPLAGTDEAGAGDDEGLAELAWLPLGIAGPGDGSTARRAWTGTAPGSRLARDGLARFSAGLFVDRDLARLPTTALVERAHDKALLAQHPQRLRGVHALLPTDEVTLVASPDAVHPGWDQVIPPSVSGPGSPHLHPARPLRDDAVALWWTAVTGAVGYVVEQATTPDFADAVVPRGTALTDQGSAPDASPPGEGSVGIELGSPADCPTRLWFRVAARTSGGRLGPWSNTVSASLPAAGFATCTVPDPAPVLGLSLGLGVQERPTVSWDPRPGLLVELEQSPDPMFRETTRRAVEHGAATTVDRPSERDLHHRARYVRPGPGGDAAGPWSNTVVVRAAREPAYQMREPGRDEAAVELLAIQRALVRLAGARGDLVAVLSLPRHHRVEDAARHLADLTATGYDPDEGSPARTAGVPPFQPEELHALSYASVFHPWIVTRTSAGVRNVPADGAVAGLIARRTIAAGAWASPGDQPLAGVVALDPVISTDGAARLARDGVNVLMRPTRDFVARTGRTLSRDEAYAPLGVRRLMILLRRAALRHGSTYVFDPHGPRFRAAVERTFETLLADLYQRGAFAGDVPSDAFRVVADSSVNPPREVDAGRFTVELRIAPSRPLVFLRVRLVEAGSGNLAVVEG